MYIESEKKGQMTGERRKRGAKNIDGGRRFAGRRCQKITMYIQG